MRRSRASVSHVPAADLAAEPAPPAADPAPAPGGTGDARPRYEVGDLIGSGAQGLVYRVIDHDLSRPIAMKVLRAEQARDVHHVWQFCAEARRQGSLEHAGIPAVYEIGRTATGEPYFTMRLVQGRTLADALDDLRRADPEAVRRWTLTKLVQVLQRVAHALDYAHGKGLVHRDLKPANVAIAGHDEVLVLDWGLSKRVTKEVDAGSPGATALLQQTVQGQLKGTPLYMSPEQAHGEVGHIDARTDVFALGAILYEILCLQPPYTGKTVQQVVREARRSEIAEPSSRAGNRVVPPALERIAMQALARDIDQRQSSALAFAEDLQAWLDGSHERDAREREAAALLAVADQVSRKADEYRARAAAAEREALSLRSKVAPWAAPNAKAGLWALEDQAAEAKGRAAQADTRAMELALQALGHAPQDATGRGILARGYHRLYQDAVDRGDTTSADWLRKMVLYYDDGSFAERLRDEARLGVTVEGGEADVTLVRVTAKGRRFQPEFDVGTEASPALWESLPCGRYLVRAVSGSQEVRVPVLLAPGDRTVVSIPAATLEPAPPGFVPVPAGPFLSGARPRASEVTLPTFWIGRRPVLLSEYAKWLDDLSRTQPADAERHVPWVPGHGPLLQRVRGRHVFCPAAPLADEPVQEHADLPVVGVTRASAVAYAAWLAVRLGRGVRLPTETEWEKAARGTDGRPFPWGERFDPTFCSMAHSTQDVPRLRPAGAFRADESPYGVLDMAGNVREWCRDDDPSDPRAGVARGGAWNLPEEQCGPLVRWALDPGTRSSTVGFRVCIE